MYFRERLRRLPRGRFIEVGAGQGIVSKTLLDLGWSGRAYDLNAQSLAAAAELNRRAVAEGRYELEQRDWLAAPASEPVDLVVSCMVLEHFADADEARYLERCRAALKPGGHGVLSCRAARTTGAWRMTSRAISGATRSRACSTASRHRACACNTWRA